MNTYKRYTGSSTPLPSRTWGTIEITAIEVSDAIDGDLMVIVGDPQSVERPLVRVHSECVFAEIFDSALCDCADQLHMAMTQIHRAGHGVLFYLRMDGRGAGLTAKVRATALEVNGVDTYDSRVQIGVSPDSRNFEAVGKHLIRLGLSRITLLTNNPQKATDIQRAGVDVVVAPLMVDVSDEHIRRLYATKAARFGHVLQS